MSSKESMSLVVYLDLKQMLVISNRETVIYLAKRLEKHFYVFNESDYQ